jgi:hypothetical protein
MTSRERRDKADQVYIKHYASLIGKTVRRVAVDQGEFGETMFGLLFDDDTIAWVSSDPEMNGAGFLHIEKGE